MVNIKKYKTGNFGKLPSFPKQKRQGIIMPLHRLFVNLQVIISPSWSLVSPHDRILYLVHQKHAMVLQSAPVVLAVYSRVTLVLILEWTAG